MIDIAICIVNINTRNCSAALTKSCPSCTLGVPTLVGSLVIVHQVVPERETTAVSGEVIDS